MQKRNNTNILLLANNYWSVTICQVLDIIVGQINSNIYLLEEYFDTRDMAFLCNSSNVNIIQDCNNFIFFDKIVNLLNCGLFDEKESCGCPLQRREKHMELHLGNIPRVLLLDCSLYGQTIIPELKILNWFKKEEISMTIDFLESSNRIINYINPTFIREHNNTCNPQVEIKTIRVDKNHTFCYELIELLEASKPDYIIMVCDSDNDVNVENMIDYYIYKYNICIDCIINSQYKPVRLFDDCVTPTFIGYPQICCYNVNKNINYSQSFNILYNDMFEKLFLPNGVYYRK